LKDNKWSKIPGRSGKRIAVDPKGNPWIVDENGQIWQHSEDKWTRVKGKARDIAIGPEGSVVSLGRRKTTGGYRLFKWSHKANQWTLVGQGANQVSVGPGGRVFYVNSYSRIFWPKEVCPKAEEIQEEEVYEIPESDLTDSVVRDIGKAMRFGN